MKYIPAEPRRYGGVQFRSALEADWACTLDHYGIEWEYEEYYVILPSGARYVPDFWLPAARTFIEVKGAHMQRASKPHELAKEVNAEVIVLIGFAPVMRNVSPYQWDPYVQWRDPLGYDTRLARCPQCQAWQWLRAELSRACRLCGAMHQGFLARAGEMSFQRSVPDRPFWMTR